MIKFIKKGKLVTFVSDTSLETKETKGKVSTLIRNYVEKLDGYKASWDEVCNLLVFDDIRGKETVFGFRSASNLLMEPVSVDELQVATAVYETIHNDEPIDLDALHL